VVRAVNIIAIETATTACAIALRLNSGEEFDVILDDERHHTETLTPGIRDLLARVALAPKELDRVVVDRGPGLYTGLRVGVATAIGLSLGASADLVAVTSLELLAHGAIRRGVRGTFVGAVDARRGELFVQSFSLDEESVESLAEPNVTTAAVLVDEWEHREEDVTFGGDGVARYEPEFRRVARATLLDQSVPPPLEALALGATRASDEAVTPLYLREADAIANFATRERPS
jgi:tRNA threonylcarbamoyladenosine biosynthesis protein TsaB